MDSVKLGERLKQIIIIKEIKRKDLAKMLKMSYNTLTKKINGIRKFDYEELVNLNNILKIDTLLYTKVLFDEDFDLLQIK